MTAPNYLKAGILTIVLVALSVASWELHLRSSGLRPSYDDGESLWSDKRAMVYMPADKATVFIGSSRNKFDLDINTWDSLTGEKAVQLAMEGTSPLPVLDDLAADPKFAGKLMIDVTEGLFFSASPRNTSEPKTRIAYSKKRTPAQRFSFLVNHVVESQFVFLDKNFFSMNAMLEELPIPRRAGVFALPWNCPIEFGRVTFDRQNIMTERFLGDTSLQNKVTGLWNFYRSMSTDKPASGARLDSFINVVVKDVKLIQARGGQVIFVRTPSSGPYLMGEKMAFPRTQYWDKILLATGCQGIHFEDYPATAHFQCPEFSHLKQADAIIYTQNLVSILQQEKGWVFPHKPMSHP